MWACSTILPSPQGARVKKGEEGEMEDERKERGEMREEGERRRGP